MPRQQPSPRPIPAEGDGPKAPRSLDAVWRQVVENIAELKPSLAGFLAKCQLKSGDDGPMTLEVSGNEFILKNITKQKKTLEEQCGELLRKPVELEIVANFQDQATKQEHKKKIGHLRQQAVSHPIVMEAQKLFDGRITDIKVPS